MLPGVHRVRANLAGGRRVEYWYAFRGGPRILTLKARSDAELDAMIPAHIAEATEAWRQVVRPKAQADLLESLIAGFQASPDFARLAARSRADLRRHLAVVRDKWGELEIDALQSPAIRKAFLDWRDSYGATPKTADAYLAALARVLSWARRRGDIPTNPLERAPRIYRVDRADRIWTRADLVQLLRGAPADFRRAVLLAAFTGLRLGDLVGLTWADVGQDAITVATNKSRRRTVAVIPITPKARAILKQIGRKDLGVVLTHSRGKPWTEWGLQTAMQRAKAALPAAPDGGPNPARALRFHDLRGTAATNFIRQGLPLADVATILGWETKRVEQIARRYVTAEAVAAGMLERLRKGNGR